MANINQINEPAQSFTVSTAKDVKTNGVESFENALTKAFDTPQATTNASTSASGLKEIISPMQTPNIIKASDVISKDIVSGKTDHLLNM
ncbi:MAG: hypothetical protein L3J69_11540, partial [Desulfobacula sp.]|nr:hypothetical protein [Desulfobacula sp.]